MRDRKLLRLEYGELVEHADLSGLTGGHVNDMVVGGHGRAYVGNFGFDLMGGAAVRATTIVRGSCRSTVRCRGSMPPSPKTTADGAPPPKTPRTASSRPGRPSRTNADAAAAET